MLDRPLVLIMWMAKLMQTSTYFIIYHKYMYDRVPISASL